MQNFDKKNIQLKVSCSYNDGHNSLRLFDIIPIFFSTQVKLGVIINNKHYELPHKLLKPIKLRILENKERSGKSQNIIEL